MMEKKTGKTARGVAICSEEDGPKWSVGKGQFIARNKALRALKGRGNEPIKRKKAISVLLTTDCPFTMGVEATPALTFQERRALYGWKKINQHFLIREEGFKKPFTVSSLGISLPRADGFRSECSVLGIDIEMKFYQLGNIHANQLLKLFGPEK
jgi:hypothetical protein